MGVMQQLSKWLAGLSGSHGSATMRTNAEPERRIERRLNPRRGLRLLIIDDCQRALQEVSSMFSSLGYQVLSTTEPERGLHMACFERPDLVILDIGMPGMNGFELLKRMRKDPLARRLPVIMMSGNPRAVELFHKLHVKADGFVRKPFTRKAMFESIEVLLDDELIPRRLDARGTTHVGALLRRIGRQLVRH